MVSSLQHGVLTFGAVCLASQQRSQLLVVRLSQALLHVVVQLVVEVGTHVGRVNLLGGILLNQGSIYLVRLLDQLNLLGSISRSVAFLGIDVSQTFFVVVCQFLLGTQHLLVVVGSLGEVLVLQISVREGLQNGPFLNHGRVVHQCKSLVILAECVLLLAQCIVDKG